MPCSFYRRLTKLVLISSILGLFLALPVSAHSAQKEARAPQNINLVMQIIDGRFHKWLEFTRTDSPGHIYMIEPQKGFLATKEKDLFFAASSSWQVKRQAGSALDKQSAAGYHTIDLKVAFTPGTLTRQSMVDNRTLLSNSKSTSYPYYNIGFLTANYSDCRVRGSGFLISPYVALTNAHNVYSVDTGGWFKDIFFSPGQYETAELQAATPFGTKKVASAEANQNFIMHENNAAPDQAVQFDYAALFFDEPFSGIDTFVPLEFNLLPEEVIVAGYPGIVKDTETQGMWQATGRLLEASDYCLFYNAYTSAGSSGSPVFSYNSQANSYRVVGIHSFASSGNFSGGPHFNDLNQEILEAWLKWQPQAAGSDTKLISLNKTALTLNEGENFALAVTARPELLNNLSFHWSSSNTAVASVDAKGLVTALAPGQAVIKAETEDSSHHASCQVTVKNRPGTLGDVNSDNTIDVQDVALVMQHVLLLAKLGEEQVALADVNLDGEVNVVDVTLLMQFSLGLINTF